MREQIADDVRSMKLLLHLSDVHLCANGAPAQMLLDSLYAALAHVCESAHDGVGVAITGDVIDSSDTETEALLTMLVSDLRSKFGNRVAYASPGFTASNAYAAPDTWLWSGSDDPLHPEALQTLGF